MHRKLIFFALNRHSNNSLILLGHGICENKKGFNM